MGPRELSSVSEEGETIDEKEQDAGDVEDERDERDHPREQGEPVQDYVRGRSSFLRGPRTRSPASGTSSCDGSPRS